MKSSLVLFIMGIICVVVEFGNVVDLRFWVPPKRHLSLFIFKTNLLYLCHVRLGLTPTEHSTNANSWRLFPAPATIEQLSTQVVITG